MLNISLSLTAVTILVIEKFGGPNYILQIYFWLCFRKTFEKFLLHLMIKNVEAITARPNLTLPQIWIVQSVADQYPPLALLWSKMPFFIRAWRGKSAAMPLNFKIQIKHDQTFRMRYIMSLNSNWLQNGQLSKFEE